MNPSVTRVYDDGPLLITIAEQKEADGCDTASIGVTIRHFNPEFRDLVSKTWSDIIKYMLHAFSDTEEEAHGKIEAAALNTMM